MALLQLPDTVLRLILEKLDSYGLQASACTCKTLCSAAQDDLLWQRHCKDAGVLSQGSRLDSNSQDSAIVGARALFMRHLRRRCCECRQPTQYEFRFLGIRLCETCERGNPHRYGLATRAQLMHVRSELECLSSSQCDSLFRQLPSLRLSGFEWFMRCQVLERAEQLAARGAKDETGEDAEGARRDGRRARRVRHGDGDGDDSGDIGGGDVAGASYGHVDAAGCEAPGSEGDEPVQDRATGSNDADEDSGGGGGGGGQRRHSLQREEQKAHKRRVKAAQRLKRQGFVCDVAARPLTTAPRNRAPKRPTARQHREAARPQAWESEYKLLEESFGVGLAGLSGLTLASETDP
mmetsp:Transcript_34572/g.72750  ORF Transcript_34572/g.72750 Transcript_34572/m.72750 type:complete len:350 (-) Transcript_34572:661-1710(-)